MARPRACDAAATALRKWRGKQKLVDVCARAEVGPTVWLGWEKDRTRPSLANALRIEVLTGGKVRLEAWGYSGDVLHDAARALQQRAASLALLELDREELWSSLR